MSFKVEIIEKRSNCTIRSGKSGIKDLFNDLLNETKGFQYQIALKVLFKKYKLHGKICSSLF